MQPSGRPARPVTGSTRATVLRAAGGAAALAAGGAVLGAAGGRSASLAASARQDAEILNLFLLLERVQEAFYRAAVESRRLSGDLQAFATAAGGQERQHAAFFAERLGSRARPAPPRSDFGDALSTPERFGQAAIDLEEAALGAYVGQGANLSRDALAPVATIVSVEARQAAWIRDLAGVSPAPRAADAALEPDEVLAGLRRRGFIR
jgi:hypothetical protein